MENCSTIPDGRVTKADIELASRLRRLPPADAARLLASQRLAFEAKVDAMHKDHLWLLDQLDDLEAALAQRNAEAATQ